MSYFGLDFLNTFLMTFPIFTSADTVLTFLFDTYQQNIEKRVKKKNASNTIMPEDTGLDERSKDDHVLYIHGHYHLSFLPASTLTELLEFSGCFQTSTQPDWPRIHSEWGAVQEDKIRVWGWEWTQFE